MNSGTQNRSLAALEKELEEKTREFNDKNAEYQELWAKHNSVLKEYRQCQHSLIDEKTKLDDVNIQIQSLQSKVQTLLEDNKKLKSENDNLRQCLSRKEAEMEETERQLKQFVNEHFIINEQSEEINEQVDEEMVEVKEGDTEDTELIVISSDEEEEPEVPSQDRESPQESVQEESLSETAPKPIPEELPGSQSESQHSEHSDIDECSLDDIDNLVDYIFNFYPPKWPNDAPKPGTFSCGYWTMLRKKLSEKNAYFCSVPIRCLVNTFKKVIYDLYEMKGLHTAEHQEIAFLAFEKYHPTILKELRDQYKFARMLGTTEQHLAGLSSLAWLEEAKAKQSQEEVSQHPVKREPEVVQSSINSVRNQINTSGFPITNLTHEQRRFLYDRKLNPMTKKTLQPNNNK